MDEQPGTDEPNEPDEPVAVVATEGLYRLRVDAGSSQANEASGFVVFIDDATPVLFTALSAFGPEGGMATQVPASGLGSLTVTLEDGLSAPGTGPALAEASAIDNLDCAPYQQGSALGDVAAFRLPEGFAGTAFEFADEPPKLGTTVTLFAPLPNLPQPRTTAKVLGVEDGLLMLEHTTTDLDMLGAVGAPVLDPEGKVVGVYVLGGLDGGRAVRRGHAGSKLPGCDLGRRYFGFVTRYRRYGPPSRSVSRDGGRSKGCR